MTNLILSQVDNSDDDEPPDEVRLWEDGFKDRYYESKFDVGPGGELNYL